jgi:hypothetical protein
MPPSDYRLQDGEGRGLTGYLREAPRRFPFTWHLLRPVWGKVLRIEGFREELLGLFSAKRNSPWEIFSPWLRI